jgi:UDP-N-acetyl-D-mannosaminuronic acid dehydrogenase
VGGDMKMSKKICIMGLGYIGLPSAALLANRGHRIHGVDIAQGVVDTINDGNIHIVEPGLDIFVKAAVESGRLKASLKPEKADVFIIAVPTPFKDNYVPNIDYVIDATKSLAPYLEPGNILILESTAPVGTTDRIKEVLVKEGMDVSSLYIAHCPERVLPGRIMMELTENDRIVGGITPESTKKVATFYRTFVNGTVLETDAKTAEMAKLVENSSRDVQIAFANELSIICDSMGINVWKVIELANRHPRVNILQPGTGVGGHCIAVDPWFVVDSAKGEAKLIKKARLRNIYKTEWVVEKIKNTALLFEKEQKRPPEIACLGLAFKPDIDDLRESPALYVVRRLKKDNFNILAVEPNINGHKDFSVCRLEDALEKADILVYLVSHTEFFGIDEKGKLVLDFCGVKKDA